MKAAPGVSFDGEKHEYWFRGKQLSGVTSLITRKLSLKMPELFMGEYREEGTHVHKAIEAWILTGESGSAHPGVAWLTETLRERPLYAEVLVSDFKRYASAVDIIAETAQGLRLYDVKNGVFNREYVTWQLSIYKYFLEEYAAYAVDGLICASIRDREYYPIFPRDKADVERLLYA